MNSLRARLQAFFGRFQQWYAGHSRRDQRIILGVLAFAAVCVAYLWGWVPLRDYRQGVADEIAEGREQLARSARVLASADSLRAERESLEKRLKQARERLLPARGGTLGAAALQERTNSLAAEKGVTVQSTQVMKEEALDPYRKVSVRLTLSGELKPFAEMVSALEHEQQLAIPIVEINRRGAVAGAKGPRTLSATIEVNGFVLGEDAKADEAGGVEGAEGAETPGEDAAAPATAAAPASQAAPGASGPTPAGATGAPAAGPTGPAAAPVPTAPTGSGAPTTTARPPTTSTTRQRTTTTTRPPMTLPPIVPRPAPSARPPTGEQGGGQ